MKITLYGAGYIGLALLSHLTDHDVTIITRRHHQEHALFSHLSHEKNTSVEIAETLKNSDVIICTVAPHDFDYSLYPQTATFLTTAAKESYFIYTSSIGVYEGLEGVLSENAPCSPSSTHGKLLLQAENIFLKTNNAAVLRLGGIYGPNRSILDRFLQRGEITGPKSWPTNMVHREDVVNGILFSLTHKLKGIYNLVDCEHPSREDLYTQLSDFKGVSLPDWHENKPIHHGGNRKVSNHKLLHAGFHFIHPIKRMEDL